MLNEIPVMGINYIFHTNLAKNIDLLAGNIGLFSRKMFTFDCQIGCFVYQWVSGYEVKGGVKRDVIILHLKSGSLTFLETNLRLIHNMKYMV